MKTRHVGAITKVGMTRFDNSDQLDKIKEQFDEKLKQSFYWGSTGAKVFNDFISKTPELIENYNIINISGDSSLNTLESVIFIELIMLTDLYQPLMDMADLVVTRGGSNTIFELLAMKNFI